jgi:mannonate dehydratase
VISISRRSLISTLAGAAVAGSARAAASGIRIGMGVRDLSDATLRFVRQLGVEWIASPSQLILDNRLMGLVPPPGRAPGGTSRSWQEADIRRILARVESFGLRVGNMTLPGFPNVILGRAGRERDLENVCESIRIAGRCGIPVLEYNFEAVRASDGYYAVPAPDGTKHRAFDADRIRNLPAFPEVAPADKAEMWSRLTVFLKAVVPVAERAGVRLSLHPNDPPLEEFRGVALPLRSIDDLKRLIETVPSPSNGITLDTGVTQEMGADVVETIRYFGRKDRISHVHFRNVRVTTPYTKYLETAIDEGQADMLAAMRAFREVGYSRMMIPDHVPQLSADADTQYAGWAHALGYMKALLHGAESR